MHVSTLPQLESELTKGSALWVLDITYEPIKGVVEVGLSSKPDVELPDRSVLFRGVLELRGKRIDESFAIALPSLIGIVVDGRVGGTRYTITTEMNEVSLFTSEKPEIIFH